MRESKTLKNGTRAKIISREEYEKNPDLNHSPSFAISMFEFCGKTITIRCLYKTYKVKEKSIKAYFIEDNNYIWAEDWLNVIENQKLDIE